MSQNVAVTLEVEQRQQKLIKILNKISPLKKAEQRKVWSSVKATT